MEYKEFEKRVLDIRSLSNKPLETKIKKLFNDISIPMQLPVLLPERNSFGQWILCSDKMPDEINSLAISSSKWIVASKDDIWLEDRHPVWWDEYGIVKWMPLPKP